MALYKLLIIDDEPLALECFKGIIDWAEAGFEIVGMFTRSMQALEYIENNQVNAILTDIKMGEISGIDLAKICHEKYPHIRLVFFSAYSDFEYAKKAISYGVCDYISKPVRLNELRQALDKLLDEFNNQELSGVYPDEFLEFSRQQLVAELSYGCIDSIEVLRQKLFDVNLDTRLISCPSVLISCKIENFSNYVQNIWRHDILRIYFAVCSALTSSFSDMLFFYTKYSFDQIEILGILKDYDINFNVRIEEIIKNIPHIIEDNLKMVINIKSYESYDKLSWLVTQEERTNSSIENGLNADSIIHSSQQFMRENYHKNINLVDIACHVGLSPNYFSAYYKKYTNENFIDTLNNIRVDAAKKYLVETDTKVSVIYNYVGYNSPRYFFKIFKKLTGLTPTEYRTQYK